MKIVRIGYGETINAGNYNYENLKIWLEADLEPWEDPIQSIEVLRKKVREIVNQKEELSYIFELKHQAERRISWANTQLGVAKKRWQEAAQNWRDLIAMFQSVGASESVIDRLNTSFPNEPNFSPVGQQEPDESDVDESDVDEIPFG